MTMPVTIIFSARIEVSLRSNGYYSHAIEVKTACGLLLFPTSFFFQQDEFLTNFRKKSNPLEKASSCLAKW